MKNQINTPFSGWHSVRAEKLAVFYEELKAVVEPLLHEGYSLAKLSEHLNDHGHVTFWGKQWNPVLIGRALKKMGLKTIYQVGNPQGGE